MKYLAAACLICLTMHALQGNQAPKAPLSASDKFMTLQKNLEAACVVYQQALKNFEKCLQEDKSGETCASSFGLLATYATDFEQAQKNLESWGTSTSLLEQLTTYVYGPNQDLKKEIEAQLSDDIMTKCRGLNLTRRIEQGKHNNLLFFSRQFNEALKKYQQCLSSEQATEKITYPITQEEVARQFTIYKKCKQNMETLAAEYKKVWTKTSGAAPR